MTATHLKNSNLFQTESEGRIVNITPRSWQYAPSPRTKLSGKKYSNGVKNRTSTLLEHCLAKICQTSIMLGT